MNNNYVAENNDLFNIEIPEFETEVIEPPSVSTNIEVNSVNNSYKDNFVSYSIIVFCTLLVIIIFLFLKKLSSHNDISSNKNTKKYGKNAKNKLGTPNNIEECVQAFLERTK